MRSWKQMEDAIIPDYDCRKKTMMKKHYLASYANRRLARHHPKLRN